MDNIITSVKSIFNKNDEDFTAERAWIETTYGTGSYRPIEKRIAEKQSYIKSVIKGKFYSGNEVGNVLSRAYRCVIDIEDDLRDYVGEVFQPFVKGGFKIINLSEQVEEIQDENVYLISWKHVFDKKYEKENVTKTVSRKPTALVMG